MVGQSDQGPTTNIDFALARYRPGGGLDPDFSEDGKRITSFGNGARFDAAGGVAVQANGRAVVVGSSDQTGAARITGVIPGNDFAVARYRQGGGLDDSFSGDGKRTYDVANDADEARDVAVQANGRILVVGQSIAGSGYDFSVMRLLAGGSPDQSFSGDGRRAFGFGNGPTLSDFGRAVAVQSDGKIVLAGSSTQGGGTNAEAAVARLRPDGSFDSDFSGNGKRTIGFGTSLDDASALAIRPDGRIVVVGSAYIGETDYQFAVAQLMPDGSLDKSFSGDGKRTLNFGPGLDQASDLSIQQNGRLVISGYSDRDSGPSIDYDFAVARLLAGGAPDPSFSGDGKTTTSFGSTQDLTSGLVLQPNGRAVVAGSAGADSNFAVARYLGG